MYPCGQLGRHVYDHLAPGHQALGQATPGPVAPCDGPAPLPPTAGETRYLPVAGVGVGELGLVDGTVAHRVEDDQRVVPLVRVDSYQDVFVHASSFAGTGSKR